MNYTVLETGPAGDYELLDSGEGEKLERYGKFAISRPDPQALWPKNLSQKEWDKAHAYFRRDSTDAKWTLRSEVPEKWRIEFGGLKFWIKLSAFKHTGLFPEHAQNWEWIRKKIKKGMENNIVIPTKEESLSKTDRDPSPRNAGFGMTKQSISVLNLFGYTGGASLAAAQAGAGVCHLDGSKGTVAWARDNAEISGLADKPIRWITDDAQAFVKREIKRGRRYDAVILDPPAFGHGPKGELWKIEDDFLPLLRDCKAVLSDKPLFFIINGYAAGYSALAYKNNLDKLMAGFKGNVEAGELTIKESKSERLLPCGIFARWSA